MAVDTVHTYASELFGSGHAAIKYPDKMTPKVVLTIPADLGAVVARDASGTDPACAAVPAVTYGGVAEVTFELLGGAMFDANVAGLMYDADGAGTTSTEGTATGDVASIVSGGRKDDTSITIKIEAASSDAGTRPIVERTGTRAAAPACGVTYADGASHTISFDLPALSNLSDSLAYASKAKTMVKQVSLRAQLRIISGSFPGNFLTGNEANGYTTPVVRSRDAVTVTISDANTRNIVIKGDSAFKAVKEADAKNEGNVMLATVTVTTRTKHVTKDKVDTKAKRMYQQGTLAADGTFTAQGTDPDIVVPAMMSGEESDKLYGLDGKEIDAGLRGTLTVDAMGTRELFNEDDMLFIDYDGDKKIGGSETIAIDPDMGNMAEGTALSIDPDVFKGGVGSFVVYYRAGGKMDILHGAKINLTAMVDYSAPSATDEAAKKTSTTFNLEGVGNPVMAYAIPHSTNGTGDKANVRVRCEGSAGCRVFLECWDDMGMREFEEAGMIGGNALVTWDAAAIEGVLGITEPTSRHSCRILSVGKVTVQQLTRDGNSKTLVNNTFIGGGD